MNKDIKSKVKITDVSGNRFFHSNWLHISSNLMFLITLLTMRPLTQFQSKFRATKLQKSVIFFLPYNYFSNIFSDFKIRYRKTLRKAFQKIKKIHSKYDCYKHLSLLIKTQKAKQKFADKHGHNILRLFDILLNFLFTTSETNFECY